MTYHPDPVVDRLLVRKAAIDRSISDELKRPLPDILRLKDLKRARLALKDRAVHLMRVGTDDIMSAAARIA